MKVERLLTIALTALLVARPLGAQEDEREDEDREYDTRLDTTVAFDGSGRLDLSLHSGEIVVTGWSRKQVKVLAASEGGTIRFDASPSRIELSVDSHRGTMGDTRYELSVPIGARILMRSLSGNLSVRGVKGEVGAHTVSGEIVIADATGRTEFESVSGSVLLSRLAGDVRGSVVSAGLELAGASGEVDVESVSGDIILTDVRSKWVRAETVSGDVEYGGSADAAGRYEFSSHSGDVRLRLPENAGGVVSLETFSGEIESDFELTMQPDERRPGKRGKRLEFTFGGGGAQISAETFSGDIIIERGTRRKGE